MNAKKVLAYKTYSSKKDAKSRQVFGLVMDERYSASIPSPVSDDSGAEGGIAFSTSYTEEIFNNIEIASTLALYQPQSGRLSKPEKNAVDEFSHDYLDANSPNFCGHHGDPEKTTYQLINSTKRTKLFAKLVSQFDDIVDLLNSTKENHTVLVPRDKALQKAMNHHPPKEYVKKYDGSQFALKVDLPTLLENHRLSIDIARFYRFATMKINGFISVASSDIIARDGVIHVLNDVLIPPKHPNHDRYPYIPRPGEDDDSPVPTVEDIIERFNPYIRED
ncbi:hypothetical protein CIHG_09672 [Coccidioides immitis H538.4]|uniref:FAS1 domain-containing protein n=1 Tax=Coccidioides immitis H538.4 TaxID=396776 RepID=A0A0J8S622_COCIT|nr:hypothetical protein CIHG_09672 [Coccidioides immitis H538.4]